MTSAGSISGQIRITARQAIAEYAALRAANAATRTALMASSAAFITVGVAALAAAAPIALLFKHAISDAADFQKKIDYFGAVTGATEADMQAVADKAMQMGRTTIFSASQMADAFVEFGKAGISTKDILNGVADATVNLAQAADISVQEASNIMASQLATFQLGAHQASHVADVLAGAANASIIDVQDLAYSLKYAGGIAATTGISFDELVTAISLLGQRGIKGSTAGTSLRQIMISLTGTTAAGAKAMEQLGIITKTGTNLFIDQGGHLKSLSQVFQILQDHEKGYTQAQQLAINKQIFNSRALSAVQILMRDGAKGFANMQSQINKVTASDVAHKRLDNLAGDWRRLKNTINTVLIQIGGPLQNFFRHIVQGLTAMVNWFGNLSPTWQKIIIYGLGIVGMFLALTGILALGIGLTLRVIAVWKDVFVAFRLVRTVILSVIPVIRALGAAMIANPWVLVAVAVIALVLAIIYCWKHFKGFRDFIKAAWKAIEGFFIGAWNVIKAVFRFIVAAAKAAWGFIYKYWVKPNIEVVKTIVKVWEAVYHGVAAAITAVVNFVKRHWKAIIAVILPGVGLVVDAIVTHWKWIVGFTKFVWGKIVAFLSAIWNAIWGAAKAIWGAIYNIIAFQVNLAKSIIMSVWNAIVSFFTAALHGIEDVFSVIWTAITDFLTTIWDAIGGPLTSFWEGIVNFFTSVWDTIYGIFTRIGNAIFSFLSTVFNGISNVGESIITGIWNGITTALSWFWDKLSGIVSSIFDFFNTLYDDMLTIGKNIIIGIWNGVTSLAGWLWDKVSGFLSDLWDDITGFFGISSPSKKFAWMGTMMVHGLANGISRQKKTAVQAVEDLNSAIMSAHTAALNTQVSASYASLYASANAQSRAALMNGTNGRGSAGGYYVENLNVNNPDRETASDSLPRTIRKLNYLTAGPAR